MQLFAIGSTPLQRGWYDLPRHANCEPYFYLQPFHLIGRPLNGSGRVPSKFYRGSRMDTITTP
jgi:hypothetical protein